jgi:hypothetical protein
MVPGTAVKEDTRQAVVINEGRSTRKEKLLI